VSRPWQCAVCARGEFPEPRWSPGPLKELDAGSIVDLLDELHTRLLDRRARVSLYVVGGSALLLAHGRDLATPDVDIARSVAAADEAAREIAIERGLAMSWLNSAAAPWVPPSPECTQIPPSHDGLTVHLAPPRHLLDGMEHDLRSVSRRSSLPQCPPVALGVNVVPARFAARAPR
jgi:hypothetical protein